MSNPEDCHDPVPPARREELLEQDNHQCQVCGRHGPGAGGVAQLHAHHIDRDPDGDEHALENLTTLCRPCHSWQHQRSTGEEAPVEITEDDQQVLLPKDYEILQVLAEEGPASTGEVADALSADVSVMAVRERLWVLMGLDNAVGSRETPLVDQDADTGKWGLTDQIAASARGRIPDDPQTLLQRMEDEQVRQALERGCDRETIATVLDVSRRTTFYKDKRARAYDFPLAAIDGSGGDERAETSGEATEVTSEAQTRLDAVGNESADGAVGGADGDGDAHGQSGTLEAGPAEPVQDGARGQCDESVQQHVRAAIDALEALQAAL